ncbi:hypothetical protein C8R44DRAFT_877461 [Mycena epipterygia]|nr:hypothetical protein C8R44DRAFT_877461 [Mycena epipterygia]
MMLLATLSSSTLPGGHDHHPRDVPCQPRPTSLTPRIATASDATGAPFTGASPHFLFLIPTSQIYIPFIAAAALQIGKIKLIGEGQQIKN